MRRWSRSFVAMVVTACALCAAVSATVAQAAAPSLAVSGNRLVDSASGATFVPRGVNWPSFEYACFYGYGYSNAAAADSVGPTAEQAALIASWHANVVRVPLNQDCWLGDDGAPRGGLTAAGYREAVASWVALLHAAGLVVILDLHWSGPDGIAAEGQRMMADDRSPAFWSSVAATFKDDRAVLFDAFNEPYSRDPLALSWGCWRDGGCPALARNDAEAVDGRTFLVNGMTALVAAIRAAGAPQPILLGGLDYANDLREWLASRPADGQLVASFHNYDGQRCRTVACWDAEIAPVAAQVPVVTGEFGETDCSDAHDVAFMNWADARGVGYLAWQWVVLAPSELANPPCASLRLIEDVNGTPAAPNGTALKAHLAALAAGAQPPPPGSGTPPGGRSGPAPAPRRRARRDRTAPRLTRAAIVRRGGGVRLALTLSETATVRAALQRRAGRRWRRVTAVRRRAARGRVTIVVTSRQPRAARYRLVVAAVDGAGNRSSRTLAFVVR